jgi:hypothetical protein
LEQKPNLKVILLQFQGNEFFLRFGLMAGKGGRNRREKPEPVKALVFNVINRISD